MSKSLLVIYDFKIKRRQFKGIARLNSKSNNPTINKIVNLRPKTG